MEKKASEGYACLSYSNNNLPTDSGVFFNVLSPTRKLTFAFTLSIAAHSLLLIKGEPLTPQLSQTSIIHARLDQQDRELVQEEQVGQLSQQNNEKISEASNAAEEDPVQPTEEPAEQPIDEPSVQPPQPSVDVISSEASADKKVAETAEPLSEAEMITETEIIESEPTDKKASEEKAMAPTEAPSQQQDNNISSDSRAQVEALEGSEDPTYTSYRRVLKQYLAQRLEAQPSLKGRVRLKIKLEYGSFATQVIVIESSGDPQLDDWARKAALAANPYPKIPQEIGSTFEFSPTLQLGGKP